MVPTKQPAVMAFVVYFLLAMVAGRTFPITRLPFFSEAVHTEAGVPVVLADCHLVRIEALDGLHGIDDQMLDRGMMPGSTDWRIHQMRRHVRTNSASEAGPVDVRIGWLTAEVRPDGSAGWRRAAGFIEDQRGSARWRDGSPPSGSSLHWACSSDGPPAQ